MWTFYSFVSCLSSSDFYRGPVIEKVRLQGLEHVLQFTAVDGKIYLRSYRYRKIFKQLHILSCVRDIYWCFSGDNINNILWKSNSRCENGFVVMETDFIYICTETDRYNFVLDLMILVDLLIIIIMTIFNEETFSLKSGLQKGPQKLKIKNLQWIKMLKDATKN